ncbi:MAG: hypothetical protein H7Z41_01220 [Cytophagales bacterium]|nr:hypothetical protein [Armatimonadota bacterium]
MKMTGQTRVIVFTAMALAAVDIAVRVNQRPVMLNAPSGDTVVAKEFRLVDNDGNTRIRMSIDENNEPGIVLLDRSGNTRAQLDTWQNTPSLILNGPNGDQRVYFGMDGTDTGVLNIDSGNGKPAISIDATGSTPRILVGDPETGNVHLYRDGQGRSSAMNVSPGYSFSDH